MSVETPEFVSRLLSDPEYAAQLRDKAVAAVVGGQNSEAWAEYFGSPELSGLGSDPERLAALGASQGAAACTCNSTTVTTTTSPVCTGTTTTGSG